MISDGCGIPEPGNDVVASVFSRPGETIESKDASIVSYVGNTNVFDDDNDNSDD